MPVPGENAKNEQTWFIEPAFGLNGNFQHDILFFEAPPAVHEQKKELIPRKGELLYLYSVLFVSDLPVQHRLSLCPDDEEMMMAMDMVAGYHREQR